MRKKPLILVAFLMMSLCMIPSVSAGYGDESPQSITSFSETLPDDVLFYPDSITSNIYFADSGEGDWENTFEKDGVYFNVTDGDDLDIHFVCNETEVLIEKWEYAIYGFEIDDDGNAKYYQYPGWTEFITFTVTPSFYNGTIVPSGGLHGISNNYTLTLKFSIDYSATLCIDYVQIRFTYMTLVDSVHYGESFADVSDWVQSIGDTWGTDGDRMYIDVPNDAGGEVYYTDALSLPAGSYYWEMRGSSNTSYANPVSMSIHSEDGVAGSNLWLGNYYYITGGRTNKAHFTSAFTIESIKLQLVVPVACGAGVKFQFDYLRFYPANESGWQHDGSTTAGVDDSGNTHFDYYSSTDGDILNLTTVRNNATESDPSADFHIYYDTTSTKTDLETDDYQFFVMRYKFDTGSSSYLYLYVGGKTTAQNLIADDAWHTVRINIAAGTGTANAYIKINVDYTYTLNRQRSVYVDWMKFYSIANYTITQSASCSTSDVFYVDSGALIGSKTTDYYQTFWHDPTLSVSTEVYNVVEANITKAGYPNVVGFNWAGTITGIGETWYLVDEKSATLDPSALTDMRFSIDVLGDWTLYGIAYIDDHTWRGFTTVTVWFEVEAFVGTLNMLLIFGGLILIPASTLYAVKGGRDEMNTDKLFYFLIAFVIGWALVIGGIYA